MLKTLLKKQLLELNQNFFLDRKTGKARPKAYSILFIAGYAVLIVFVLGGIFSAMASGLCAPLVAVGLDWLYFALTALVAIFMGLFGSAFTTYAALYLAKDNDLLLSMPIPVRYILAVRLLGVYIMGLVFSAVVMIPSVIVYFATAKITAGAIVGSLVLIVLISLLVLVLSCALGWVVAKCSANVKNKSAVTTVLSLLFVGIYYAVYFKANTILQNILQNASSIGSKLETSAWPLYALGRAGTGDVICLLTVTAAVVLLTLLTWVILARSFIPMATASQGGRKARYVERTARLRTPYRAMLAKEFGRFTSSANYMLNCGFGILFMAAAAVFLLIRGVWFRGTLMDIFGNADTVSVLAAGGLCLLTTMNDMTAPSVSLEGKNIWIPQSLPLSPWTVLKAKLSLQLLLTTLPMFLCAICAVIALRPGVSCGVLMVLFPLVFTVLNACFGLFVGLKHPDLSWTNEIVPIKQSLSVLFALLAAVVYSAAVVCGFLLLGGASRLSPTLYLTAASAVTVLLTVILLLWLKRKGSKVFAEL